MKPFSVLTSVLTKNLLGVFIVFIIIGIAANASAQEFTSITLNWTAPGDDGDVGQATAYDVRYSTSPITDQNWDSATPVDGEPAPSPAGSVESFTRDGLQPSTTYYFAIKTSDEAGNWSGLSNVATVTTIDNIPPGDIADLTASPE
jgi:chitodextrinase